MSLSRTKVAIAGCGSVGSTLAFNLAHGHVCDEIMLIDINKPKAAADALDIAHSLGYSPYRVRVYDGDYSMCGDADAVVLALSAAYSGTSREDMLASTGTVISTVVPEIMKSGFNGIFIVITNPVDTVTYMVKRLSGLPSSRVIGTGTCLNSARLRYCIADRLKTDVRNIDAFFLGEHGPSQFVPWSCVKADGVEAERLLGREDMTLIERTVTEIKSNLGAAKGAAVFGIAAVTARIVRAALCDGSIVMPVSVSLDGRYGFDDVCIGVPAYIGSGGIGHVPEYSLTDEERQKLQITVSEVSRASEKIRHLIPN